MIVWDINIKKVRKGTTSMSERRLLWSEKTARKWPRSKVTVGRVQDKAGESTTEAGKMGKKDFWWKKYPERQLCVL